MSNAQAKWMIAEPNQKGGNGPRAQGPFIQGPKWPDRNLLAKDKAITPMTKDNPA
jgi:hypothetical protein